MKKLISVVLPCHNEAENITGLVPEIITEIPDIYDYEIILVDDGSDDDTYKVINKLGSKNRNVKGITFYKRFGHQAALLAGIRESKGDAVITLDADYQHPPSYIPKMLQLWENRYDLILMQKKVYQEKEIINFFFRKAGYALWKVVSEGVLTPGVSEFRLMDKSIKKFILKNKESQIFLRGIVSLAAKNPVMLPYTVGKRKFGDSSYNFWVNKDLFITGLISFSTKPLRIATYAGLLLGVSAAVFLIVDFLSAIYKGRRLIEGYLTIVFLLLILNGFQIFFMGILGEYLGVIFKEVKKRPPYIIKERVNSGK